MREIIGLVLSILNIFSSLWSSYYLDKDFCETEDKPIIVFDLGEKDTKMIMYYSEYCKFEIIEFCSPYTIEQSMDKLIQVCQEVMDVEWLVSEIEKTEWGTLIRESIQMAAKITDKLNQNAVIIQSADYDHDIGVVLSCIVQILIDPHYHTIEGCVMDKEWLCLGHPFSKYRNHFGCSPLLLSISTPTRVYSCI